MEKSLHDADKDWFLSTLNTIVNNNSITIGITIVTHGFIISGHLACGKLYFESMAAEFSSTLNSGKVEQSFLDLANRVYNSDHVKEGPLSIDYIHIKDATFYNGTGTTILPKEGLWWRGRISEVSGYSLGIISSENS